MFFTTTSCEDILETESSQLVFNPSLDQKTDSMYYTLAMLKGVQMAIDQNVLINEMRGDLTSTTEYTETSPLVPTISTTLHTYTIVSSTTATTISLTAIPCS